MSEKKYLVPDEMTWAADNAIGLYRRDRAKRNPDNPKWGEISVGRAVSIALEAALRWQSENPIVPTDEQIDSMTTCGTGWKDQARGLIVCWVGRMYLASDPEVPEEIKEFLIDERDEREAFFRPSTYNSRIIEAFNRGRKKA